MPAFDTELAAYLIDPGRSEYDLDDLLAEQGLAVAGADGDGDAVLARRAAGALLLHAPLAARIDGARARPADGGHRAAARARAVRDGARRRRDRLGAHGRDRRAGLRAGRGARAAGLRAGGRAVRAGLAQAARRGAVRAPRAAGRPAAARRATRPTPKVLAEGPRPAPDRGGRRGVARALEAALDLPAAVPRAARRGRPPAHDVLAGHGRHRPAVGAAPEPAEHPDPHAARARAARDVRGRARAPRCSRSTTRRSSCASSPTSRARSCCARPSSAARTSTRSRPPRCSARRSEELSKDERNRAKAVNFGIIYGISAHGLSEQLEHQRDEAQAYIDTYRGRMPLVAEFIERAIARRARARLRRHAARPPPADPRAAGAELERPLARRAPGRQHRDPGLGGRHHQARDGAHPPAARRGGPRRPPGAADPRRTAGRGARRWRRPRCATLVRRGDGAAPTRSTRPWRSTAASATTGSPPKAEASRRGFYSATRRREFASPRYNPPRKRRRAVRCRVESEETPYRYAPNER